MQWYNNHMEALGIKWTPKLRKVADLKHWDKNPRTISEANYARLKRKVIEEGMHQVLTVDVDDTVLSGNRRLDILTECGVEQVWCMEPERALTDEERDKVGIQSNIIEGAWDSDMLANTFDIPMLLEQGFTKLQLGINPLEEDGFDADKDMDNVKIVPMHGDIYQLGDHRIMCGDSSKEEDVLKLMDGEKAHLVYCDPPYSVNYKSGAGNSYSEGKYGEDAVFSDDKTSEEAQEFYTKILKNLYKTSTDDSCIFWWFAHHQYVANINALIAAGWHESQILIWLKGPKLKLGLDYLRTYEPCMFGWKKGNTHFKNKAYAKFRDAFNLDFTDFQQMLDFWYVQRDPGQSYVHPTQRPIRLVEFALRKHSEHDDIVLDLFSGSGSTILACAQSNRRARVMELDPKYVHAGIKRFMRMYPQIEVACINRDVKMALFKD